MTSEEELTLLRALAQQYPNIDCAVSEVARLSAELNLPKATVHVISDIHGDDAKMRHVINNASGTLRPIVEDLFAPKMSESELKDFFALLFYPRETLERLRSSLEKDEQQLQQYCRSNLRRLFDLIRALAPRYPRQRVVDIFPDEYRNLLIELLREPSTGRGQEYYDELIDSLVRHGRGLRFVRLVVRVVRNLAIEELVIAGDCWDRGPRGDRVVEYLQHLPRVSFIWGNHDTAWLGACLGQEACIAHVLRISCRYRRLSQLEEGYGINLQPLEYLARTVYKDDPADIKIKGTGLRQEETVRRMQKAAAVMQFKLEGQTIERNPHWNLENRRLLHRINREAGTVEIDGVERTLRDTHFPTLTSANPYELSPEERKCMDRIKQSFFASEKLWEQMQFLVSHGQMALERDGHLIFHACVPVDENGDFQSLEIDGKPYKGRELFGALDRVMARVLDRPSQADLDLMWYLWCGPQSPLFGKDRICTFEIDFVEEKEAHVETKNPYFQMIHEADFCDRILTEMGANVERGLIVNGHVPVKIEKGENPLKRSGKAITIDGAFSVAYGDHGYTLVLEPERTLLAKHHHFESVDAAIEQGVDIIPTMTEVRHFDQPRYVADTERGEEIRREIHWLEKLIRAYRENRIRAQR